MWRLYDAQYALVRLYCFLAGHVERSGCRENYEEPYCARCYIDYPQDKLELPKLLNRVLVFVVERSSLADRLFCWTCEQSWCNRLPSWWEV